MKSSNAIPGLLAFYDNCNSIAAAAAAAAV